MKKQTSISSHSSDCSRRTAGHVLIWLLLFIILGLLSEAASAGRHRLHTEQWYQSMWCRGEPEVRLPDNTRVDCLTSTHAWEIDFASKWYECVQQGMWYATFTGTIPGCALIVELPSDMEYVEKARISKKHYQQPIEITIIRPPPLLPTPDHDQ